LFLDIGSTGKGETHPNALPKFFFDVRMQKNIFTRHFFNNKSSLY